MQRPGKYPSAATECDTYRRHFVVTYPLNNSQQTVTMKFLSLLSLLPTVAVALSIQGAFGPSQLLSNPTALPPSTSLTLTTAGITRRTLIRRDNTFSFDDVPEGSYLLDVQCPTHYFMPLRVDVQHEGNVVVYQTFRGNEWGNTGERKDYPIVCPPSGYRPGPS